VPNHQEEAEHAVSSISRALLPYVQRCFNSDEETMPCTVDERFIMINEQIAERIVKGIQLMYGIEFAWEVVSLDMSCLHLALRVFTARRALAPFSAVVAQGLAGAGEPQLDAFPEEKDASLIATVATAL
jgi:phosphatidylethanolamine N-methyltransferase